MARSIQVPAIHINGTSKKELLDGYKEAYRAIREAIEKLRLTAPHGRDYYVQEGNSIKEAIADHVSRIGRLVSVQEELEFIASEIQDSGGK